MKDKKFYSIFFKKLRFPKAEPLVARRNERNTLSVEAPLRVNFSIQIKETISF